MAKEIPETEQIQFVGVSKLEPEEQMVVNKLSSDSYQKIKRMLKNITNMTVHVKSYENEGSKKKFSLHVRISTPTIKVIESCKSHDFDLSRALHKAFDDIRTQIKHKFHD